MGGRKILITVTNEQYEALEKMAEKNGLGRVSVLAKSEVVKAAFNWLEPSEDKKTIAIRVGNYRELANYVEQKRFGSIESFATFAMESVMQRNQLTEAQKARIGKLSNKRNHPVSQ